MKKLLLLGILILISGCINTQEQITGNVVQEPFCKEPYVEFQTGKCCLDNNNNNICDDDDLIEKELQIADEKLNEPKETIETPKVIEKIIEEIPEVIEETCPFTCEEEYECRPIYKEEILIRWTCTYVKG